MVVRGACMVAGGGMRRIRRDTVNERAVRILLECILVLCNFRCATHIVPRPLFLPTCDLQELLPVPHSSLCAGYHITVAVFSPGPPGGPPISSVLYFLNPRL